MVVFLQTPHSKTLVRSGLLTHSDEMPRRSAKRHGGKSHRVGGGLDTGQTVMFRGRYLFSPQTIGQITFVPLNPLFMDNRLLQASDEFQEYRFKRVKVHMFNGAFTALALAYTPVAASATPTYSELAGFSVYKTGNGQFGSGNPTIELTPAELSSNAPKWFRRGTAYDDLLETQGFIYLGSGNQNFSVNLYTWCLIEYEVELKAQAEASVTMQNPALTPLEQKVDDLARASSMVPNPGQRPADETSGGAGQQPAPRQPALGGPAVLVRSVQRIGVLPPR